MFLDPWVEGKKGNDKVPSALELKLHRWCQLINVEARTKLGSLEEQVLLATKPALQSKEETYGQISFPKQKTEKTHLKPRESIFP